jgi:uncharacterized protein with beta-barrel porin domain
MGSVRLRRKQAAQVCDGDATDHRQSLRWIVRAAAALFVAVTFSGEAAAQCGGVGVGPNPNCPTVYATNSNAHVAGQAALLDGGSQFLQKLSDRLTTNSAAGTGSNPQGGGAEANAEQRYRTWFESYGMSSRTDSQGDFAGDRRRAFGGVAGFGVTVAPGATLGLSIDQSHTKIDITGVSQGGRFNLTQIGAIAAYETGPWNLGANVVHGFANVHTSRTDGFGTSTAAYDARLWGAMAEVSYYQALPSNSRFVPKLNFEWMRSHTDAFAETGGASVAGSAVTASRSRMLLGGELGHSWLFRRTIMDVSAYGRLVDNLSQKLGTIQISDPTAGALPRLVGGIRETKYGADSGAALAAKLSDAVRVYAIYDGRFRGNFVSHTGTVGAEFRW